MERHDVVIAGAGPAGLALAEPLARRGYDVLVCERNARIGEPVRTSGGSWPADLRRLGLPDRLWHPITTLSFRSRRSRAVVEWGGPVGCALDVTATWRYLADRARAAGATVETGTLARMPRTGMLTLRGPRAAARCTAGWPSTPPGRPRCWPAPRASTPASSGSASATSASCPLPASPSTRP